MRGTDRVSFRPFYPLINYAEEKNKPYICRLAPSENGFSGEWINADSCCEYRLFYGKKQAKTLSIRLESGSFAVDGLKSGTNYEIYIESSAGIKSNTRLVRTGKAPEGTTVVNYLHPDDDQYIFSGKYLCSPSVTRLANGTLFAGMDVFGSDMPQDLTLIMYSDDDGSSWHYKCDIFGFFWGLLFSRGNDLYLLGLSTEYGNLKITRSGDNGSSWSTPVTLFYGGDRNCVSGGLHRAPMQLTEYNGRLYTSIEYGSWKSGGHLPGILSVDINSDYMIPENWQISGFLPFDRQWADACNGIKKDSIEGNLVITPGGTLQNILRWDKEKALILNVVNGQLSFEEIRNMPVSDSMFKILRYKNKYLLVSNRKPEGFDDSAGSFRRNILSLYESDNLRNWVLIRDIIDYGDKDMMKYGFQYPSAFVFNDTLYLLIRSAYNGAHGYHDSNTILFTKIKLS